MIIETASLSIFNEIMEENSDKQSYVVGAGIYGSFIGKSLSEMNYLWKGYIDKNVTGVLDGKEVISYGQAEYDGSKFFIISSTEYGTAMCRELLEHAKTDILILKITDCKVIYDLYDSAFGIKTYTSQLKQYKNCQEGRRAFIIGNGPSLDAKDLSKLSGEISFGFNSIYGLYEETSWRPTYYLAHDELFTAKVLSDFDKMKYLSQNCDQLFTSITGEGFVHRNRKELPNLNYYMLYPGYQDGGSLFSDDISEKMYYSGTVTYAGFQLACYMGIKEIYLLGIDFSYARSIGPDGKVTEKDVVNYNEKIHKAEEQSGVLEGMVWAEEYKQLAGYISVGEYADQHGIKIYNATRGGKLEVFDRVDFDNLF